MAIDHFHYDVTHAKVSGSCSKDRTQGRSIAGKFKIIHKNTCNAMVAELVDHITSIMCIIERNSSDKRQTCFLPHQDTPRDNNVEVRKLYFARFSIFFYRFALGALQKLFSGCTLDFQAGNAGFNSICYHPPPGHTPGDLQFFSFLVVYSPPLGTQKETIPHPRDSSSTTNTLFCVQNKFPYNTDNQTF